MSQVIVVIDVVGSTLAKESYGESHAIKMIGAALQLAEDELCAVDPALCAPGPSMGDSILLIGGSDPIAAYRAAVIHQAKFAAWPYNRMPVKIAMGYGDFSTISHSSGAQHHRGTDLDFLHRICDMCPPGRIVVAPALYALLNEAGFGGRFHECREDLRGLGLKMFYESNGYYQIPRDQRQRYTDRVKPEPLTVENLILPEPKRHIPLLGRLGDTVLIIVALVMIIGLLLWNNFQLAGR